MVGMYAAGVTYEVTGKGFDPEALQREHPLAAMTCRAWRQSRVTESFAGGSSAALGIHIERWQRHGQLG